jgi:hypothetical protein
MTANTSGSRKTGRRFTYDKPMLEAFPGVAVRPDEFAPSA